MLKFRPYRKSSLTFARVLTEQDYSERGGIIQTLEGPKKFLPGDYLAHGVEGEEWPIDVEVIRNRYERLVPVDASGFIGLRSTDVRQARLLEPGETVEGYQLDPETEHYLVQSGENAWPVKRSIFEATYELAEV